MIVPIKERHLAMITINTRRPSATALITSVYVALAQIVDKISELVATRIHECSASPPAKRARRAVKRSARFGALPGALHGQTAMHIPQP